jgi:signal transduction histidine kinase/CheY-like chemotaxis protein
VSPTLLRRLPIRTKLVAMIMLTSATVLLLAGAGYLGWDYFRLRADLAAEVDAQAQIVLENSFAALSFQDRAAAVETLATLQSAPRLRTACLYDARGGFFAAWQRGTGSCPPQWTGDRVDFRAGALTVGESGSRDGKRFGSVYLESDTGLLTSRLRMQAAATATLLVIALAVALALSSRLQAVVSGPILELSRTAKDVSAGGDYSLRARKVSSDELGSLVDAFNRMLQQIQQREAELREANRLKDEFLATLSHELRTPLNAILGWTRLLRAGALPAGSADRALEKVERNAQAQTRLIEDLLEVSRITTGKLRLELRPIDLAAIVHAAVESVRPAADARQVSLDTSGTDLRVPTLGDPDRLQQVVWNLLSNAVKFTPAGGRVVVTLTREDGTDRLQVSDTGIGIEPAFLDHVFDTFRQADASSTRQHGGLGLGLSIARRLVELHGGTIAAASDGVGRGASFTVRLPVRAAAQPGQVGDESSVRSAGAAIRGRLAGITTLVVDDDDDALQLLVSVMEGAGATVFAASSADEALRVAVERRPRVLVSDLGMPGSDGVALLEQVRSTLGTDGPEAAVALTAYAGERDRRRTLSAGYQRHLAKPFDPLALVDVICELLAEPAGGSRDLTPR